MTFGRNVSHEQAHKKVSRCQAWKDKICWFGFKAAISFALLNDDLNILRIQPLKPDSCSELTFVGHVCHTEVHKSHMRPWPKRHLDLTICIESHLPSAHFRGVPSEKNLNWNIFKTELWKANLERWNLVYITFIRRHKKNSQWAMPERTQQVWHVDRKWLF